MRRGTTPRLTINVEGVDLRDFRDVLLTIRQNNIIINKTPEVEENALVIELTQEETLRFREGVAKVQMRLAWDKLIA